MLLSCLCELRDVKRRLAASSFSHHYRAWGHGLADESSVARREALKELQELLAIERWILWLGGAVPCGSAGCLRGRAAGRTQEIEDRCRMLHLVQRGMRACNGQDASMRLRGFLAALGDEEASRMDAVCTTSGGRDCPAAAAGPGR